MLYLSASLATIAVVGRRNCNECACQTALSAGLHPHAANQKKMKFCFEDRRERAKHKNSLQHKRAVSPLS